MAPEEPAVGGIPELGAMTDALSVFREAMDRWLAKEQALPMLRLAFGAVLVMPVSNREEGYRQLSDYLPFGLDPDGSSDFSYRINRPRESAVLGSELRINRLSTWTVGVWTSAAISLAPSGLPPKPVDQRYACRLQLDINTSPVFPGELPQDRVPALFEELIELGTEIAANGDVK